MKLIDKDALVAEIERRLHFINNWIEGDKRRQMRTNGVSSAYYKMIGSKHTCESILDFANTTEVKEVDLNNEYIEEIYSHIDSIKDTADRMTSGNFMHNRAAIKFSANTIAKVLELMGLSTKK